MSNMNPLLRVIKYIFQHNPWYLLPKRFVQAIFYQAYKRTFKGIFSKTLFNGKQILLFPHNPISSAFVYTAIPDKNEILALRALADPNTIFLDIGANIGAYSVLLMDKVKSVYAFEAHPLTADYCQMNFLLNGVNGAQVIPMAVSEDLEPKYFTDYRNADPINRQVYSKEEGISVPAITLDEFAKAKKFTSQDNFILKIDVEGFEHEVFKGAKHFLENFKIKAIIFETFSSKNNEIVMLLRQLGYEIQAISAHNLLAKRI